MEKKLLFSKIRRLEELPLPSYSLLRITGILKSGSECTEELIDCITKDHVLTAQVFRLIYQKHPLHAGSITSTSAAICHLHGEELKELATYPRMLEHFGADEELEWSHAYSCSLLMKRILEDNEIYDMSHLVLAAQLHDIGKVVLRDWSPKKYVLVRTHAASSLKIPFYRMEDAILQTNHAEAGGALLESWGFPEKVWKVVANHHVESIPDEYVFETALLQFVNWVDSSARGIECNPPAKDLLFAAGIDEIDADGCKIAQRAYISALHEDEEKARLEAERMSLEEREEAVRELRESEPDEFENIIKPVSEQAASASEEDEERVETFDPDAYIIQDMPEAMLKREAEILSRLKKKF